MKLFVLGIPAIKIGKHNVKDPRLDQADKLVEAKKKVYAQVDVLGEEEAATSDAILAPREARTDLILKDLEFVETRLGREPPAEERSVLAKIQSALEAEAFVRDLDLSEQERQAISAHALTTQKPIVLGTADELANLEELLVRAVKESGWISFLTVGGKENRAWLIPQGTTAWEAAGTVHSDMQKGFIRAEIIAFADFIQAGGETPAKRAGKQRLETKNYVMQDYDLTNFRFSK